MKTNESSITSLISAFGRAYHSKYDEPKIFNDFIAEDLISEQEFAEIGKNMVQGIQFFNPEMAKEYQDDPKEILKWITQVQLSPTPLARAAFCESVLLNEMNLGVKQYVILGAGMDTFCFRHPELENKLEIYEIDHPATQTFKKERLNTADINIPPYLHFMPMDFTKRFSYQTLADKGFKNKQTFFSLLGVTYYLSKEETSHLFHNLFAEMPEGSSIVFDYADEGLFEEKGLFNRVENMVKMAAASGEPMKSNYNYIEVEKMLEDAGLKIYEHLSPADINERFFHNRTDHLKAFETIHYIHAVKK